MNLNQTTNPKLKETFVTINILITIGNNEQLFQVHFLTSSISLIIELIGKALDLFNEQKFIFNDEKSKPMFILKFITQPDEYELKPSKKNGKPKLDYPPFHHNSILCETQTQSFSLLFNENNLKLIKPGKKVDKAQLCRGISCLIF